MKEVPITVDFETHAIKDRPEYPPKPVGVAVRWQDGSSNYYAWGHESGNNCSVLKGHEVVRSIFRSGEKVLFHHSAYDIDVAESHFDVAPPANVEDTLYLSFLKNPHEETISLKPLSEKYLLKSPDNRDMLREWIVTNIPAAKKKPTQWGAHIAAAPGELAGEYAIDDVNMTYGLWEKFKPEIQARGMIPAYERELALTGITLSMERTGVAVDVDQIKKAITAFTKLDGDIMRKVRRRLGVGETFNVNSPSQLGEALLRNNLLSAVIKTPTGKISTTVANLRSSCSDTKLVDMLAVHSVIEKNLTTFLSPWLQQAEHACGRILPSFHQVRNRGDDGGNGARSGRYSSSNPNLQNVSANVEESRNKDTLALMQAWLKENCGYSFVGLRDYIIPDEDTWMCCVDFNQQELRLLAHFERGVLMKAYNNNPGLDIHDYIRQLIKEIVGLDFPRKYVKVAVFGIVYGMGVAKLAIQLGVGVDTAKAVRDGVLKAVPGIRDLMVSLKKLANKNLPTTTWGGRQYFCEEPKFVEKYGKWMSFEYKLLNYTIQPSAADMTKQAMLNVDEQVPQARIAVQVHDELVCMIPRKSDGAKVVSAMCDIDLRVPVLAEAKYSNESWARAK